MLRLFKGNGNYERLYNNLSNNPEFREFFEKNKIEKDDMVDFANHIAGFKTKSIEQHEIYNARQKQQQSNFNTL